MTTDLRALKTWNDHGNLADPDLKTLKQALDNAEKIIKGQVGPYERNHSGPLKVNKPKWLQDPDNIVLEYKLKISPGLYRK